MDLYYMQDSRGCVGNDVLWWAKGGNGYTTDLRAAELYTREDAQRMHNARPTDIPWPQTYIGERTRVAVDMQYLDRTVARQEPALRYYVQAGSSYDGNNLLWRTRDWEATADLSLAQCHSHEEAQGVLCAHPGDTAWPTTYIDAKTRPTADRRRVKLAEAFAGTGIVIAPVPKRKTESLRCHVCGGFISAGQMYISGCPKCGADNRP